MSIPIPQFLSSPFPLGIHMFVLYVCLYFSFLNKIIYTNLFRLHICALIYGICFSLSDLLHSIWQPLSPSMLNYLLSFYFSQMCEECSVHKEYWKSSPLFQHITDSFCLEDFVAWVGRRFWFFRIVVYAKKDKDCSEYMMEITYWVEFMGIVFRSSKNNRQKLVEKLLRH